MSGVRSSVARLGSEHQMLLGALLGMLAFHGSLLVTGTFRRTYDAYVHIFFADHYARGWFETWEPRWYTGFTVTSYPPGTHQLVALASRLVGLEAAFVIVQLTGIALVVIGVYRLTEMLFDRRAAGFAAGLTVLSTSIAEAVHVFGQLPTICSLGLLLNALPFTRRWVVTGDRRDLIAATALLAGTTAMHHVTTLFGAVFFVAPVVVDGLVERLRTPHPDESGGRLATVGRSTIAALFARRLRRVVRPGARTVILGMFAISVLIVVVFPYWIWSSTDPISQVPIPHGSRENFLADLNAGLVFWLIPWGPMLVAVPYACARGLRSSNWPYTASLGVLALLGTGGTTPIPRLLLGGAFDILTLDRFTFWATILIIPFAGQMAQSLVGGSARRRIAGLFGGWVPPSLTTVAVLSVIASAVFTANLTHFREMQPDPIDPAPIVSFLEKDDHDRWRYLTLGFGDQMAWLSAQTTAQTVDGNYHSARRLPELITTPIERLEGAKFRGIPGLGSLQQFLGSPERYNLKYVFANDRFYDPLLQFSGWRSLQRLENDVIVWEREDVPPLSTAVERPTHPRTHALAWGIRPMLAVGAAAIGSTVLWWRPRPGPGSGPVAAAVEQWLGARSLIEFEGTDEVRMSWKEPMRRFAQSLSPSDAFLRAAGIGVAVSLVVALGMGMLPRSVGPADAILAFYDDMDFRRFELAWQHLDPAGRPTLDEYLVRLSVEDGLLDSYAALESVEVRSISMHPGGATAEVDLVWTTSLVEYHETEVIDLVERSGEWFLQLPAPDPTEPVQRLARVVDVEFEARGRRTVTAETTTYDDVLDRPELELGAARLVLRDGLPSVVGFVDNVDVNPAALTITGQVLGSDGTPDLRSNARHVVEHSLLPSEGTPFRIDFEGVAGLEAADFDPHEFTAVSLPPDAAGLRMDAGAVVTTRGLTRPLTVQQLSTSLDTGDQLRLSGEVLNLGSHDVTVAALLISIFDLDGSLIWVDWTVVPDGVRPGLTSDFAVALTERSRLGPVDLEVTGFVNGLPAEFTGSPASWIPAPPASGYSGLSVMPVVFVRSGA